MKVLNSVSEGLEVLAPACLAPSGRLMPWMRVTELLEKAIPAWHEGQRDVVISWRRRRRWW